MPYSTLAGHVKSPAQCAEDHGAQVAGDIDIAPHLLCGQQQLLSHALLPGSRQYRQVADVGHVAGPLICYEWALLNPLRGQERGLHVDYHRAKETNAVR